MAKVLQHISMLATQKHRTMKARWEFVMSAAAVACWNDIEVKISHWHCRRERHCAMWNGSRCGAMSFRSTLDTWWLAKHWTSHDRRRLAVCVAFMQFSRTQLLSLTLRHFWFRTSATMELHQVRIGCHLHGLQLFLNLPIFFLRCQILGRSRSKAITKWNEDRRWEWQRDTTASLWQENHCLDTSIGAHGLWYRSLWRLVRR